MLLGARSVIHILYLLEVSEMGVNKGGSGFLVLLTVQKKVSSLKTGAIFSFVFVSLAPGTVPAHSRCLGSPDNRFKARKDLKGLAQSHTRNLINACGIHEFEWQKKCQQGSFWAGKCFTKTSLHFL